MVSDGRRSLRRPWRLRVDSPPPTVDCDYRLQKTTWTIISRNWRISFAGSPRFSTQNQLPGSGKQSDKFKKAYGTVLDCFCAIDCQVFGTLDSFAVERGLRSQFPNEPHISNRLVPICLSLRHAALAEVKYLDDPSNLSYLLLIKPTTYRRGTRRRTKLSLSTSEFSARNNGRPVF